MVGFTVSADRTREPKMAEFARNKPIVYIVDVKQAIVRQSGAAYTNGYRSSRLRLGSTP